LQSINDLQYAEASILDNNLKWSIVQSYYAIFHGFRTLLLAKGFRDKSHHCLREAIEALYVDDGELPVDFLYLFDEVKISVKALITGVYMTSHLLKKTSIRQGHY